jgi:hypothetical protein
MTGPTGTPDHIVDCNGGGGFTTIQTAIDASDDGDWIEVWPCTYPESLSYNGKGVWVGSRDGAATTVIDADHLAPAVTLSRGEGDGAALVGFTIRDGDGYGIYVDFAAVLLKDLILDDTEGDYGIYGKSADLEVDNVVIDDSNEANDFSLYMDKGSLTMARSSITCDDGAAVFVGHGAFHIDSSTITCESDDAIENEHAVGVLMRSQVIGRSVIESEFDHFDDFIRYINTTQIGDIDVQWGSFQFRNSMLINGTMTFTDTDASVLIENSVMLGGNCAIETANSPPDSADTAIAAATTVTVEHSNFWSTTSMCNGPTVVGQDNNLSVDPQFTDALNGNYTLTAGSPLIDAGKPAGRYNDIDGSDNDIGIYGGRFTVAGGW